MRTYLEDFIYQILLQKRRISSRELADICRVSLPTVRKILRKLQEKNLIVPIYGGAELSPQGAGAVEETELIKEYQAIAHEAVNLIQDGDAIFLGPGKTVATLCQYLKPFNSLTVFTNSLYVIEQLASISHINVISLGGILQRANMAFSLLTENLSPQINISKCFISCAGVNSEMGIFHSLPVNRQTEEQIVAKSKEVILLADKHKFGLEKAFVLMPIEKIHIVVSTEDLDPHIVATLCSKGLRVKLAPLEEQRGIENYA